MDINEWRPLLEESSISRNTKKKFEHLLSKMFRETPSERPTARNILQHPSLWGSNAEVSFLRNLVKIQEILLNKDAVLDNNWEERLKADHGLTEAKLKVLKQVANTHAQKAVSPIERLSCLIEKCFREVGKVTRAVDPIFQTEDDIAKYFFSSFDELVDASLDAFDNFTSMPESDKATIEEDLQFFNGLEKSEDLIPGTVGMHQQSAPQGVGVRQDRRP